jgi:hypothetical protein
MSTTFPLIFGRAFLVLLLSGAVGFSTSFAGEFRVAGQFKHVLLVTSPPVTNIFQFKMMVKECDYRISVFRPGYEFRKGHEEIASDGKDGYRLFYGNENPVEEIEPEHVIEVNGFVTEPGIPAIGPTYTIYAWFPFLSGCYLRTEPVGEISCEFIRPDTFGKCRRPVNVQLNPDNPAVVEEMTLFHTGLEVGSDQTERRLLAPYDKGYRQLVYQTKKSKTVGDSLVPELFEWSAYETKQGALNSNDLVEVWRIYGHVESAVSDLGDEEIVPQPRTRAAIFDHLDAKPYFAGEFRQNLEAVSQTFTEEPQTTEKMEDKHLLSKRGPALVILFGVLGMIVFFVLQRVGIKKTN